MEDLYQLAEQASKSLFQQSCRPSSPDFPFQVEDAASLEKLFLSKYDSGLEMGMSRRRLQETIIPSDDLNDGFDFKQEQQQHEVSLLPYLEDPHVFSTEEVEFLCEYESNKENVPVVPVPRQAKDKISPMCAVLQPSAGVNCLPNTSANSVAARKVNGKDKKTLRVTKRTLKVTKRTLKVSKGAKRQSVAKKAKKNVKPKATGPKAKTRKPSSSATGSKKCLSKSVAQAPGSISKKPKQRNVKKEKDGSAPSKRGCKEGNGNEDGQCAGTSDVGAKVAQRGGGASAKKRSQGRPTPTPLKRKGGDQERMTLEAKKIITAAGAQAQEGQSTEAERKAPKAISSAPKPQEKGGEEEGERDSQSIRDKRRAQNRISSARFRNKNRSARLAVGELQATNKKLEKDLRTSQEHSSKVLKENSLLRYRLDQLLAEVLTVRQKFWLRKKISFKTVAVCVSAFLCKMH